MKIIANQKVMRFIPKGITRAVGRQVISMRKQSPHIFFVAGVGGVVVSTVLACRSTLKLSETLDEIQNEVKDIKELRHAADDSQYPMEEWRRDAVYIYGKGAFKLTKLYAPAVVIGVVSVTALVVTRL